MKRALFVISIILAVIAFIAPVATAQLVYQVATNQGSSSLCLNRQGGTATNVITYSCNDENDDFQHSMAWWYVQRHRLRHFDMSILIQHCQQPLQGCSDSRSI